MAMRSSAIGRVSASRIIEASRRISRSFSDKGTVLSEEEKARETIYVEIRGKEMLERLTLRKPPPPKPALENEKSDKPRRLDPRSCQQRYKHPTG